MLPSKYRLRENRDFRRIYSRGRSYVHPLAVLYVMKRESEISQQLDSYRIGFVVSKKQGNAVVRNRIKRRMREAFKRHQAAIIEAHYDLVFVARSPLKTAEWSDIVGAIQSLLKRAALIKPVLNIVSEP